MERVNLIFRNILMLLLGILVVFVTGCSKKEVHPVPAPGKIMVQFHHVFDTLSLIPDTLAYEDAFGNHFEINELQYFLSDIRLHLQGGGTYRITDQDGIHYVDARLPETQVWSPADAIPAGRYDSVSFTFGLNAEKNITGRFPDPPERDMFWPEILGGGYHYMKMNTKWVNDTTPEKRPFMMHVGIGQLYDTVHPDSIVGFVQNFFFVKLDSSSLEIRPGDSVMLLLTMHIDRWFDGPPTTFNLAALPQGIMQNQPLMHAVCLNGRKAFTVKSEE